MAAIALVLGGMLGSLTAAVAVFGIGVPLGTGAAVYFATAAIVALPLITMGMRASVSPSVTAPRFSEWETELQGFQSPAAPSNDTADARNKPSARRSA